MGKTKLSLKERGNEEKPKSGIRREMKCDQRGEKEQQRPSSASYWSRQDGRYHRQTPKPTKTVLVGG